MIKTNLNDNIMKTISFIILGFSLLFICNKGLCKTNNEGNTDSPAASSLYIMSSPELKTLATNWADEFCRTNQNLKITIQNLSENQCIESNTISVISEGDSELNNSSKIWKMEIGHNAVVPIINAKNPLLNEIYRQGVSTEKLAQLLSNPEKQDWKSLISGSQNFPIHYYIVDNPAIKTSVHNFAKTNFTISNTALVATAEELLSTIQKNIYAIGFCKLTDVRDANTKDFLANIKVLPFDKNKNGRLDSFENIYSNMDAFTRGVWIGKHPIALCGSIYAISESKPTDKNALDFLNWINTDGQKYLNTNGYCHLASTEIKANVEVLDGSEVLIDQTENPLMSSAWFIGLLAFIATVLIVLGVVRYAKIKKLNVIDEEIEITSAFDENSIFAPKGLYFDKSHTWAFMEKDGNAKIGLDDFLQHVTGSITRIKMKEPGEKIRKGEKILTIMQNGKQLNISSPISGIIKEQNQILANNSTLLNSAPYSEGWIYLIEPKNWLREIQFLFMSEKYKEWLQDEFVRLKDFLANSIRSNKTVYSHIILQDGGELSDNVLADLGPEVWEDFQTNFIDTSK
jgi:glycine cleavage system H lipoate-binding protein/ABC-type phosphate transport system substrate-binding protein